MKRKQLYQRRQYHLRYQEWKLIWKRDAGHQNATKIPRTLSANFYAKPKEYKVSHFFYFLFNFSIMIPRYEQEVDIQKENKKNVLFSYSLRKSLETANPMELLWCEQIPSQLKIRVSLNNSSPCSAHYGSFHFSSNFYATAKFFLLSGTSGITRCGVMPLPFSILGLALNILFSPPLHLLLFCLFFAS